MLRLYFWRSDKPTPSDASIEDRSNTRENSISSCGLSLVTKARFSTVHKGLPDIAQSVIVNITQGCPFKPMRNCRECLFISRDATFVRPLFEPPLFGFFPRVLDFAKFYLPPELLAEAALKFFRILLAICATRDPNLPP